MVNRLKLNQVIIRRFTVESDDDDYTDDDSDIEIIGNKTKQSEGSCSESTTNVKSISKIKDFTNYKIFVRNCGQNVERFVDSNGNNDNPFVINDSLDQLMRCSDLTQISSVLGKEPSDSQSNVSEKRGKQKNTAKVMPIKDKSKTKKESIDKNETEIKGLDLLNNEGIKHLKKVKKVLTFKCLVCDLTLKTLVSALNHSQSDSHLKGKFGDDLKGIDALFTIDSESIGDARIAIARRKELKRISSDFKQKYLNHGIRLKNGFGYNSYICLKCDLPLGSIFEVDQHFMSFETDISEPSTSGNDSKQTSTPLSPNNIDTKLLSNGIKTTDCSDGKFYCVFCNIYFDCKRLAVCHVSDIRHKKQKMGENLNEIDSKFTIQSERIDELEVAFGRKFILKSMSPKEKVRLTEQSIRLQDGIGSSTFKCLKCDLPIGSVQQIEEHLKSLTHSM